MGEITILGEPGAEPIVWDPHDRDSVAAAFHTWRRLKRRGYRFSTAGGRKLNRFNKRHGQVFAERGTN